MLGVVIAVVFISVSVREVCNWMLEQWKTRLVEEFRIRENISRRHGHLKFSHSQPHLLLCSSSLHLSSTLAFQQVILHLLCGLVLSLQPLLGFFNPPTGQKVRHIPGYRLIPSFMQKGQVHLNWFGKLSECNATQPPESTPPSAEGSFDLWPTLTFFPDLVQVITGFRYIIRESPHIMPSSRGRSSDDQGNVQ